MMKHTDILFLSKDDTNRLDTAIPLQSTLLTTLTASSNKEILEKLLEFDLLKDLVN